MSQTAETIDALGPVIVYRVGFWHDVFYAFRAARLGQWEKARYLPRNVRRSWRRRSYWNGWLAEPQEWPDGLKRCGAGWTYTGALRDLARQVRSGGGA